MKPTKRGPVPRVLEEHGERWSASCVRKKAENPNYRIQWTKHGGVPVNRLLLPPLEAMTQSHCSYCDGYPLDDIAYPTIDHFLPKGQYPELTYNWNNLYLACPRCQNEKETRFDLRIQREEYQGELLRPDEPNYKFERYFLFNYKNGHIEPNPRASEAERRRAKFTIDKLGLNDGGRPRSRKRTIVCFARSEQRLDAIDVWPYRFILTQ
ncbi:MAG: TIGR02646 family protein [Proteobacteria bacterium]|nr:TIGR02646 family protein [Pseudomonadota bacterium]